MKTVLLNIAFALLLPFLVLAATPTQSSRSISDQGGRWALIIHVGPQGRPSVENLAATLLESYGFTKSRVIELYDSQATLEAINKSMDLIFRKIDKGDFLFVYVSLPVREDYQTTYFRPADGKPNSPWTWLEARSLFDWLAAAQVRASMVIYPSCAEKSASQERLFALFRYGKTQSVTQVLPVCFYDISESNSTEIDVPAEGSRTVLANGLVSTLRRAAQSSSEAISVERLATELNMQLGKVAFVRPLVFPNPNDSVPILLPRKSVASEQEARYRASSTRTDRAAALTSLVGVSRENLGIQPQYISLLTRVALDRQALLSGSKVDEAQELRGIAIQALGQIGSSAARDALGDISGKAADEPEIRRAALSQLFRLSSPREEDRTVLRRALNDLDPTVREVAARGVILVQDTASAETVARLAVEDMSIAVRSAAIQALAALGRSSDRSVVIGLLKDANAAIRLEAAAALGRMGQDATATSALVEMIRTEMDTSAREAAIYSIAKTSLDGDRDLIAAELINAIRTGPESIQRAAAVSLGQIGGKEAVHELQILLMDRKKPELVRVAAAEALGQLKSKSSLQQLRKAASGDSPGLRRAAVSALGAIGGNEAIDILLDRIGDEDPYVRAEAQRTLSALQVQPTEIQVLTAKARSNSPIVRLEAVQRLSRLHEPESIDILIQSLADDSAGVREAAISGLSTFSDAKFLPLIIRRFGDEDFRIRRGVAAVLGRIPSKGVVAPLVEHSKDENSAVRAEVIRALGSKPTAESLEVIFGATNETEDTQVRVIAVESLGRFKADPFVPRSREIVGLLQSLARNDPSPEVRKAAIDALSGTKVQFVK